MQARAQDYSQRHLITLAEIANAIAIARGTAGHDELRDLAQRFESGELTPPPLYPPHQPWQHGGDVSRMGTPTADPSGVWRMLFKKASQPHQSDKDAFSHPPAASTWHMLSADVYALAQQPIWKTRAAAALRDLACRYSPDLLDERLAPAPETQQPAPVVAESAGNAPRSTTVWTPGKLAEVRAYREKHGTRRAAEYFGVSEQLIRRKLPRANPTTKGFSAFTHRPK